MSYGVFVHFSLPPSCLLCTEALSVHAWNMVLMSGGVQPTQPYLTGWNLKLFVSSTLLFLLTILNLYITDAMLHLYLFSTAIFMLIALVNLLTACFHPSRDLAAQSFLLLLIPILSISLMQELTTIFNLSSLTLVNSGTLFLCLLFHLPMT